jgi:glycosyltransferase involved in cell wall biosynthesis
MHNNLNVNSNILLVANYKSDVGFAWWLMENFWSEISKHYQKLEKNCILIYPEINSIPSVIKSSPIDIIEHDFSDRSISSVIKLIKIIRQNKIGYIYLTDRAYYDWLYLVARIAGVSKIVNHDHLPGERKSIPIYKKQIKKLVHLVRMFSCDFYIGVSRFVTKRTIDTACVPERKCTFVHNGIKQFDNTKSLYAHEQFSIPKDSRIIVTTGRATFYKGIDILIKCAHILLKEKCINNLYFLHVGDGPHLQNFKDMSVELGVDDKFIFAGFRNDIPKILSSCDIGIQLSVGEAFSLSIIEYMGAGLATLAPNNCGNSEAIENGVNGILFTPGDVNDIVGNISYILTNTEFAIKIKNAARLRVVEEFTIEKCNQNLLSVLDKQFT